ncbi:hypothetical protein MASR2M66_09910 [Chloroflexota bacterium]
MPHHSGQTMSPSQGKKDIKANERNRTYKQAYLQPSYGTHILMVDTHYNLQKSKVQLSIPSKRVYFIPGYLI